MHSKKTSNTLACFFSAAFLSLITVLSGDALALPKASAVPGGIALIELHISNVHARESFRHHSYIASAAKAVMCGFGVKGYGLAIDGLAGL